MANLLTNNNLRDFLNILEEEDLIKLALTTTQKLIKEDEIRSRGQAVDLILRHSTDILTVLNRKIIKKEFLFQYLNDKNVPIVEPSTKLNLITRIMKFWDDTSQRNEVVAQNNIEINEDNKENKILELANKFCEWFYNIYNENQPIGDEHFFQDCVLKLNLISDGSNICESVENNPSEISDLLFKTKCEHGLFFNPNLTSDGIRGKMDSHGLVLVFACGTLHTKDSIVGVFEQMFALARDPFSDNNWKIKNTVLNLKSKSVNNVPVLENTSLGYELQLKES